MINKVRFSLIPILAFFILIPSLLIPSFAQQYVSTPDEVVELTAIPGNNEVLLTWIAPFDGGSTIKSYKVVVWEVGKDTTTTYSNLGITITEARITGLTNGFPYSFQVFAVNDKGQGADSKIVSATPTGSPKSFVPEKITNLQATRGDQKVTLTWTPPFDFGTKISSYQIYYWEVDTDEIKTKTVTSDSRTSQITELKNETPYSFKIVAKNSFGHGPESNVVSETPSASTTAEIPNRVRGINAIPSNNQVFLSWIQPSSNGSPITGYQVLVSQQGSETVTTYPNLGKDTKTTITGLKNGVNYNFKVIAVNSVGPSQPSFQVNSTPENRVPIEVTNLKAVRGNGSVTLSWSIPESAQNQISGYWIREYKTGESRFTTHVIIDNISQIRITGLENGVSYGFSVIAVTEAGIGPVSKIVQVTPFKPVTYPGAPAQITDLKGRALDNQVILSWKVPDDFGNTITGYDIQYRVRGENSFTTIKHGTSNSATITGLTSGVTYDFKVIAKNSAGIGPESNTASVTIPNLKSGMLIPSWIKTNAQWWSQDKISDSEYVMAIEFLINEGIIKLK